MKWIPLILGLIIWAIIIGIFSLITRWNLRHWIVIASAQLVIIGGLLLIYRDEADRYKISRNDFSVVSIESGNVFLVRGVLWQKRSLTLADTALPIDKHKRYLARKSLEELLSDGEVTVEFKEGAKLEEEPWPVIAKIGQKDISRLMAERGLLSRSDSGEINSNLSFQKPDEQSPVLPESAEQRAEPGETAPIWQRALYWLALGVLGCFITGRIRTGEKKYIVPFLILLASFTYGLWNSRSEGISIIPPLLGLSVIGLYNARALKNSCKRRYFRKHDVFISYKSDNVHIARYIADQLIASGVNAWFAEYNILLVDRDFFQKFIDEAIGKSKYGLAFTNDLYAASEYCYKEMDQLLEHCGPGKTLEIMIPQEPQTRNKFPQLKNSPSYVYRGDLNELFAFIKKITGWKVTSDRELKERREKEAFEGECLEETYTIDVSGWELVARSFHGGGPCYVMAIQGRDMFWNLQYGRDFSERIHEARKRRNRDNEKELYNEMIKYAHHYFGDLKPGYRIGGVHLLHTADGTQFGVTYFDGKFWKRRYSLLLLHPDDLRAAEFVFTFQFQGNFRQFLRHAWIMDELVTTLRWPASETNRD